MTFEDYILHKGKILKMYLPKNNTESLDLRGLVTYDKKKWEHDLLAGTEVSYGKRYTFDSFPVTEFDYVLDCRVPTGHFFLNQNMISLYRHMNILSKM